MATAAGSSQTSSIRRTLFASSLSRRPQITNPSSSVSSQSTNSTAARANNLQDLSSVPPPLLRSHATAPAIHGPASRPRSLLSATHTASQTSRNTGTSDDPFSSGTVGVIEDAQDVEEDQSIIQRSSSGRLILPELPTLPPSFKLDSQDSQANQGFDPDNPNHMTDVPPDEDDMDNYGEPEAKWRDKEQQLEAMLRTRRAYGARGAHGHATRGMREQEAEEEELLALVRESLRRRVVYVDETNWMFE